MTTTDTGVVLQVEGVSAGYGSGSRAARVLRDISLSVAPGRTMGIVGESGSGKSTLARVLVGQLTPLAGSVSLGGRDLATMSRQELRAARRQIQLVPQDPYSSLDPRMTVGRALAEAIDPGAPLRRVDRSRIIELLETVALDGDAADRLPHEFSGGQRQRIVLARALAVQPQVIIADEVTSALDSSVQAEVLTLLLELQKRKRPRRRLHHPRSVHRAIHVRRGQRPVPRQGRGAGRDRPPRRSDAPVHGVVAHERAGPERADVRRGPTGRRRRRTRRSGRPTRRVRVPPAMPAGAHACSMTARSAPTCHHPGSCQPGHPVGPPPATSRSSALSRAPDSHQRSPRAIRTDDSHPVVHTERTPMTQTGTFTPEDLARLPEIVAADLAPDGGSTVYAASTRDGKTVLEHTLLWRQIVGGAAELLSDSDVVAVGAQYSPRTAPGSPSCRRSRAGRRWPCSISPTARPACSPTSRAVSARRPRVGHPTAPYSLSPLPMPRPVTVNRPYRVTRPVWRRDGMGLVEDVLADVWTVPAAGGAPTRLTFHDGVVSSVQWSPDGTRLLYACFAEPNSATFALRTVQADGSRAEVVMNGDYLVYPPAAAWLSDGRIVRTTAWDIYRALDLVVHDPATGSDTPLGVALDGQIGGLMVFGMNSALFAPGLLVDPATDDVYLYVQTGGRLDLHRISTSDGRDEVVLTGDASVAPLALRGRHVLLARSTFADPASLVVLDVAQGTEQPASTLDRDWLASTPFTVHELHFTGADGTAVEAWFLEPDVGSGPYPTVLNIHGGPFAVHGHGFSIDNHLLTSAGYGVLLVNYRGSSGYGEDFAASLLGDWGHHDAGDLLAGIDHAASLGLVDPARLGSFGLSGGGYLTSWLLTHSDRFSAGIAECPVTDWNGMVGSDIPQVVSRWMGSDPGHGPAAMSEYARVSPATYAADCSTPMLIIEHESDLRCPSGQGDILYNALVLAGCTTEMLRLPGMFHVDVYGVRDLAGRTERLAALTDWFDRYLKP